MEANQIEKFKKCRGTGKVSFPSKSKARWTIIQMRWSNMFRRDKVDGRRIKRRSGKSAQRRIYYCSYCGGYHITKWSKNNYKRYQEAVDEGRL